jgi:hypothetical protein
MEIFNYQQDVIIPILRVKRLQFDQHITKADKETLDDLRRSLYQTLDECLIKCSIEAMPDEDPTILFNKLMSASITELMEDSNSSLNTLFRLTKKYEEKLHETYASMHSDSKRWNDDLYEIQIKYINPSHLESFKEITNINAFLSLEHLKKEAFFLLSDGRSMTAMLKMLKVGNYFMPYTTP